MRKSGNGLPEVCASNLLQIVRGEVPFDRVRGRDGSLVDRPNAADDATADAEWLLNTYEPRVEIDTAGTTAETETGDFLTRVNIKRREEEEEWQS